MLLYRHSNQYQFAMDNVLFVKIVSSLVYPLGLLFVLLVTRISLSWLGWRFGAKAIAFSFVVVLLLSSNLKVAEWLATGLESQYPQQAIATIEKHDAIIVLGGGVRIPSPPARHTQLGAGSDRLWYAVKLYRAGKAGKIILSGGNVYAQTGLQGEAYYARELLQEWGVAGDDILLESSSRTTQENSRNIETVLREQNIRSALLVTSALHMPRAYSLFKQLPIEVTAASADVLVRQLETPEIFDWIPSANALQLTTVALHEYYGIWFTQLRDFSRLKN